MSLYQMAETGHPIAMLVAVVGALAIGLLIRPVAVRILTEKVRRLSRSCRALAGQLDTAEQDLREERQLVNRLVVDLSETRRALRTATANPSQASPRHMTIDRIRAIADRPLPGESTGAHAALTEETDQ